MAIWINEFHYDNAGTDTGEFIEVAGPVGTDLAGWTLVLYNGANGLAYDTRELAGGIAGAEGIGAVAVPLPVNGLQNGSPDGIALVDPSGAVAEFLSYEGDFVAADGPAAGLRSTDIGVAESSSTPEGASLGRPDAPETGFAVLSATPGALNLAAPAAPDPGDTLIVSALGTVAVDGAEVVAFDPEAGRAFVASGDGLAVVDAGDPQSPQVLRTIAEGLAINAVAVSDKLIAVAVSAEDAAGNGHVVFFDRLTLLERGAIDVGPGPSALSFNDNGRRLVVANEGEAGDASGTDPDGSVSVVKVNLRDPSASRVDTFAFDDTVTFDALDAKGVRVSREAASAPADLRPENVTVDGDTAYVTLQHNNAVAVIHNIRSNGGGIGIDDIVPLGTKDHSQAGAGLDPSDRDGGIAIATYGISGLYMPDQIATLQSDGRTYILTANEGRGRDGDESRGADLVDGDPSNGEVDATEVSAELRAQLADDALLGRLAFSRVDGDIDGDGLIEDLHSFGARSFSIFDAATGARVYDSGDAFEQITARDVPAIFNADGGDPSGFDARSDDSGPEPGSIATGVIDGRTYAFVGLQSTGGVMIYDVTDPADAAFERYVRVDGDMGTGGLSFVAADDSPNGQPLLAIAGEGSGALGFVQLSTADLTIPEIQGAGHVSAVVGETVRTGGIVTATDTIGFYLQDAEGDGDIATSDAIFVFTGFGNVTVEVGDAITLTGRVGEFTPGGSRSGNLSTTQLSGVSDLVVLSSGNDLPEAQIIGPGGRILPTQDIDDDAFASFDPETDGIDFFESLEAMRVTASDLVSVTGTNRFGEIYAVNDPAAFAPAQTVRQDLPLEVIERLERLIDNVFVRDVARLSDRLQSLLETGAPTGLSERGTLNIAPGDFNPERIQIDADSGILDFDFPVVDTGARLGDVTGVVTYNFGNYEIAPTEDFTAQIAPSDLAPEVSGLTGGDFTVASYNVLNLDIRIEDPDALLPGVFGGVDDDLGDGRFDLIATQIVEALGAPMVIGLQEIQDDTGVEGVDDVVAATETLATLVARIEDAGGPSYTAIDNPFIGDDTSGGIPGGNIRNVFLYDDARLDFVEGSLRTIGSQSEGEAFFETRLPLVADFEIGGEVVTVINVHLSSKGGSAPIMGVEQNFADRQEDPEVNGSVDERRAQADEIADFVAGLLSVDDEANVVVLGDFNEFEFVSPLEILEDAGLVNLTRTLPEDERYSFVFQGNSQSLDHILVSQSLAEGARFDAVHLNTEFAETDARASDHDPLLAQLDLDGFDFA